MKKEFWIPSLLHLFTDFFCIYSLLSYKLDTSITVIWFAIYNCLAFLLQPIIGALIENYPNNKSLGSFGCGLVILGALIPNFYSAVILCGIGNALFHVCIGKIILDKAEKTAPLGVFISFGAIGVGLASVFSNLYLFYSFLLAFIILLVLNMFSSYDSSLYSFKEEYKKDISKNDLKTLILPCILIVSGVFLRGFFGKYSNINVSVNYLILYIELAMFLGKFWGGFIFDLLGGIPLICLSLVLSIIGVFFPDNLYICLLGIFGVNLLMGLTMELIRRANPSNLGLGFGLLASSLMAGTYLGAYFINLGYYSYVSVILMCLNSVSLLVSLIVIYKKGRIDKKWFSM